MEETARGLYLTLDEQTLQMKNSKIKLNFNSKNKNMEDLITKKQCWSPNKTHGIKLCESYISILIYAILN